MYLHWEVFAISLYINEGDEFYFSIDTTTLATAHVCLAYYPKPAKSIAIKVVNK
jgi:hypothetical protein